MESKVFYAPCILHFLANSHSHVNTFKQFKLININVANKIIKIPTLLSTDNLC